MFLHKTSRTAQWQQHLADTHLSLSVNSTGSVEISLNLGYCRLTVFYYLCVNPCHHTWTLVWSGHTLTRVTQMSVGDKWRALEVDLASSLLGSKLCYGDFRSLLVTAVFSNFSHLREACLNEKTHPTDFRVKLAISNLRGSRGVEVLETMCQLSNGLYCPLRCDHLWGLPWQMMQTLATTFARGYCRLPHFMKNHVSVFLQVSYGVAY